MNNITLTIPVCPIGSMSNQINYVTSVHAYHWSKSIKCLFISTPESLKNISPDNAVTGTPEILIFSFSSKFIYFYHNSS